MSEEYREKLKKLQKYLPIVKKQISKFRSKSNCLSKLEYMRTIHDVLISNKSRLTSIELSRLEEKLKRMFNSHLIPEINSNNKEVHTKQIDPKMMEFFTSKGITIAKLPKSNKNVDIVTNNICVLTDSDSGETDEKKDIKRQTDFITNVKLESRVDDNEEESLLVPMKTVPSKEYEKRSHLFYYNSSIRKNPKNRHQLHKYNELSKSSTSESPKSNDSAESMIKKDTSKTCETIDLVSDSDESIKAISDKSNDSNRSNDKLVCGPFSLLLKNELTENNRKLMRQIKARHAIEPKITQKIIMATPQKKFLTNVNLQPSNAGNSVESTKLSLSPVENKKHLQESYLHANNNNRRRRTRPSRKRSSSKEDREYVPYTDLSLPNVQLGTKRWSLRTIRPQRLEEGFTYNDTDFELMENDTQTANTANRKLNLSDQSSSTSKNMKTQSNINIHHINDLMNKVDPTQIKIKEVDKNTKDDNCIEIIDDDDDVQSVEIHIPNKTKEVSTTQNTSLKPSSNGQKSKNINCLYHALSNYNNYCLICGNVQKEIVNHYVNFHPTSEVLISRLPRAVVNSLSPDGIFGFLENFNEKHAIYLAHCIFCNKECKYLLPYWFYHFTMHTGEYSYECTGCGIKKPTSHLMKTHTERECTKNGQIKSLHTFDKTSLKIEASICTICNYIQLNSNNVIKHLLTQHGIQKNAAAKIKTVILLKICGQYQGKTINELPETNYQL